MFLVDSHCHLDLLNYKILNLKLYDILKQSNEKNVKLFLSVSTSIQNFNFLKKFVKNKNNVLLSCGIHPLNVIDNNKHSRLLLEYSKNKQVIALGETGLDYYHSSDNNIEQTKNFRHHIRIAIQLKKPLIIHTRQAINDTIKILIEEHAEKCGGIIHSFTESIDSARILLNMGFFISFSGIITFKKSNELRQTAKFIPIENMLIETDSPYLSPIPHRGKENQPKFLYDIAIFIAKLKKIKISTFSKTTTNNFFRLFNLDKKLFK